MRRFLTLLVLLAGLTSLLRGDDSAEKTREIDKLLGHLGYDDSLPRMLGSIQRTTQTALASLKLPQEVWDEITKALSYEEARAMSAKLYAAKLTLEEVKAANAFYEGAIGRSYAKKVAEIGEQEFLEAREWAKAKTEPILLRHLKAKGVIKEPNPPPAPAPAK